MAPSPRRRRGRSANHQMLAIAAIAPRTPSAGLVTLRDSSGIRRAYRPNRRTAPGAATPPGDRGSVGAGGLHGDLQGDLVADGDAPVFEDPAEAHVEVTTIDCRGGPEARLRGVPFHA